MKKLILVSFLLLSITAPRALAQFSVVTKTLNWNKGTSTEESFTNCFYQEVGNRAFPLYYDRIEVPNAAYRIQLSSTVYTRSQVYSTDDLGEMANQPTLNQFITYQKGRPILNVEIFPYRAGTGYLERLESFRYTLSPTAEVKRKSRLGKAGNFAGESVLATGEWFKFKITQDGIHKITGQQLANLNIDVSQISAKHREGIRTPWWYAFRGY